MFSGHFTWHIKCTNRCNSQDLITRPRCLYVQKGKLVSFRFSDVLDGRPARRCVWFRSFHAWNCWEACGSLSLQLVVLLCFVSFGWRLKPKFRWSLFQARRCLAGGTPGRRVRQNRCKYGQTCGLRIGCRIMRGVTKKSWNIDILWANYLFVTICWILSGTFRMTHFGHLVIRRCTLRAFGATFLGPDH